MPMGLGTAVAYLTLDATGFARGIDMAMMDAERLNTGFSKTTDTLTRVGSKITGVGKILTAGITAPVIGFGAASIKSGAEFDASMSNVKAVSSSASSNLQAVGEAAKRLGVEYKQGATDGETAFNALRATAIKMGNDTKFTAKESADALYYMGLAGWNAEQMINGIPGVLALASAGNADLATTSDIVTDAITGFGHSADEMVTVMKNGVNQEIPIATRLADIMASTMANSNTDVLMLGESFKYVSPIAGSFGYSMEDVSLSLGLMANAGVKASQAGTTLRQGLKRLVAPTDKAQESMSKYGWSAYDAAGNTKPLRQQLQELRGIFGNLNLEVMNADGTLKTSEQIMEEYGKKLPVTDQERLTDAVNVFGTTALPGMLALMSASDESFNELAKAIDTSSDAFDGLGYAQGMQAVQLNNLQGDWTLFKSALGTTKQIISDMANGPLRNLVQGLTSLVRKFNEADPATQKMIAHFALLAAGMGPTLVIGGKLLGWVANIKQAFSGFGNSTKVASDALNTVNNTMNVLQAGFINTGNVKDALLNNFLQVPGATGIAGEGFAKLTSATGTTALSFSKLSPSVKGIAGKDIPLLATASASSAKAVKGLSADIVDASGRVIASTVAFDKGAVKVSGFSKAFTTLKSGVSSVFASLKSYVVAFITTLTTSFVAGEGVIGSFVAAFNAMTVAMAANPIGAIVLAIGALIAVVGVLIYKFATEEEAIKSVEDAQKSYEQSVRDTTDALGAQGDAVQSLRDAQKSLAEVEAETGESGEALYNSIRNGTLSFNDLSDAQLKTYNAYAKVTEAQRQSDEATLKSIEAKQKETAAAYEVGLSLTKETGNWNEYRDSVVRAWQEGSLSTDQAKELMGKAMTEMSDKSKLTFMQEIPNDMKEGLNPKQYETTWQQSKNTWAAIGEYISDAWSTSTQEISDQTVKTAETNQRTWSETGDAIKGAFDDLGNKIKEIWGGVTDWFAQKKQDVLNVVEDIKKGFSELKDRVTEYISGIWDKLTEWVSGLVNDIVTGISDFINNAVEWFSQLPDKISEFISSAWDTVSNWASDMIDKAVETGSGFINNIVEWFKNLPGRIWEFLSEGISRAGNFVSEMAQKGMSAATSLIQNLMQGAADIGNKVLSIGTDIVNGVWNGIVNAKDTFVSNVKSFFTGMVDGVKSVLGIHSPSTVFRDQVGKNIVLGVSKGIDANKKEATKSLQQMLDEMLKETTYSYNEQYRIVVDRLKKRNRKVGELEQQLQNTTDKNERLKLSRQISRLNKLISNDKQALSIVQSNYIKHCEEQLKNEERYQDLSNKQIEEYWKKVRSQLKKGTNEYDEATKKIVQVQTKTYNQMLKGVEKSLGQMVNVTHISLSEQFRMWVLFSREAQLGSVAYAEAVTKVSDANKDLLQNVTNANNTLTEGIAKTATSVSNSIQSIIDSYNSAVTSTKETLMGLSGLFEQFTIDESVSGSNLLGNLKTQVQGLEQWNAVIDNMFARGLPQDLIEELQAMGPKAMGSIANLLKMTDTQLTEYIELWNRKNAEAQAAAEKMVDKSTYVEQIREVIKQGNEEVVSLVNEYNETIKQLGLSTQIGAQAASTNFVAQFVSMLQGGLSDVDFDALFMLSATPISERVGLEMVKPINMGIIQGLQKAVEQATETISNSTEELVDAVNESIDEEKVEIKGYKDVGVNIVGNITSGIKDESPKLDNQVRQTGLHSQQEFINSVKSKEKDVNSEGVIIGKQLDDGMASGINMYVGNVAAAAAATVRAAIDAAKAEAAISSPSKRMANEVGKWLPLGMAKGFADYTPQAIGQMQDAIDDGISSIQATDVEILPNVSDIGDEIRDAFMNVQDWFLKVAKAVELLTNSMKENMQEVVDITDGALYNVDSSSSMNKLISSKNTTAVPVQNTIQNPEGINNNTTNNFVFNSPKPIDEVQASRLLRQTSRDLAEGFG